MVNKSRPFDSIEMRPPFMWQMSESQQTPTHERFKIEDKVDPHAKSGQKMHDQFSK
jgi:hypothetical protein